MIYDGTNDKSRPPFLSSFRFHFHIQSPVPNIPPIKHALEGDKFDGFVGEVGGGAQGGATGGDAEHASTGGDELAVFERGAGVEDVDAGQAVGRVDAADG